MSLPSSHNEDNLVLTYNKMMHRVHAIIENAEAHAVPSLQLAINMARDQIILLGIASLDEADQIATYIKKDISDAADYLIESSHDYSEWTMLDIDIAEKKFIELFLSVADKTRLELEKLSNVNLDNRSLSILPSGSLLLPQASNLKQLNATTPKPRYPSCKIKPIHK